MSRLVCFSSQQSHFVCLFVSFISSFVSSQQPSHLFFNLFLDPSQDWLSSISRTWVENPGEGSYCLFFPNFFVREYTMKLNIAKEDVVF